MTDEQNKKNQIDNPLIVEVDGFRFMPLGTLSTVKLSSQFPNVFDDSDMQQQLLKTQCESEDLPPEQAKLYKDMYLPDIWPPSAEKHDNLRQAIKVLEEIERSTGVSFQRDVGVAPPQSNMYAVDDTSTVFIDVNEIINPDASQERFRNILLHEAAHLHYGDLKSSKVLGVANEIFRPLKAVADFNVREPELFTAIIERNYDNVAEFESHIDAVSKEFDAFIAPIISAAPNAFEMTKEELLKDIYGEQNLTSALQQMSHSLENTRNFSVTKLGMVFPVTTDEDEAIAQHNEALDAKAKEIEPVTAQRHQVVADFITSGTTKFELTSEDKEHIADVIDNKLKPLIGRYKAVSELAKNLSHACEYRADDFVVCHSKNPQDYARSLADLEQADERQDKDSSLKNREELNLHPPLNARIARVEVFANIAERARKENPDADVLKLLETGSFAARELDREVANKLAALEPDHPKF